MSLLQSIILGIIQGLTEFLPISSSAHLVLTPYILRWQIPAQDAFVFDVLVQVATLIAVFAYFWKDIIQIICAVWHGLVQRKPFDTSESRLGWFIILASIPAGLIGLLLKDIVEQAFASPALTAVFLLCTACLLVVAERVGKRTVALEQLTWKDALWIGFFQALAIFPGLSRSGATITGGMTRNLQRPAAARFSFLISIPIMLAAGLLAMKDLLELPNWSASIPVMTAGFIASAIVGYLSIRWLLKFLNSRPLYIFAVYCVILAAIALTLFALGY